LKVSNRKHHDLQAWQVGMRLAREAYLHTSRFPREELYGLTNQIRRSAVSIPSNIAEGAARSGTKEFLHYLSIARGSMSELETQLLLARDLGFLGEQPLSTISETLDHAFGVIGGLINALRKKA
jgi:four helix bundle protein